MKLIAHRGNTKGPRPELENKPDYIIQGLIKFDVEVDVWFISNLQTHGWFLGHDKPTFQVPLKFLEMPGLWVHVKNIEGMEELSKGGHNIQNYFFHEHDTCSQTSGGFIWTCRQDKKPGKKTVLMLPDIPLRADKKLFLGDYYQYICNDWVDEPFGKETTSRPIKDFNKGEWSHP